MADFVTRINAAKEQVSRNERKREKERNVYDYERNN